jgi:hypothetical protein
MISLKFSLNDESSGHIRMIAAGVVKRASLVRNESPGLSARKIAGVEAMIGGRHCVHEQIIVQPGNAIARMSRQCRRPIPQT